MGFNSVVTSRPQFNATTSANHFVGFGGAGEIGGRFTGFSVAPVTHDVRVEERRAERTRIAQELHDTLLQGLFAVSMQLHAAVDHLPEDSAAKPRFAGVRRLLDRVLEQGRCAVQGLRSSDEHPAHLAEALADIPNELSLPAETGFRVVVRGRERELKPGLRDEIYRIGREAVVNAYRHSGAKDIEAEIEFCSTELRIVVRDNGCGFAPKELQWARKDHWGLQGMRERAEQIGARLRLWSGVGLGTEVKLTVPARIAFE